ncbi:MAG: N-acetyltransferase [Betaproteobacteria bacterium]|nr:N-acetyltransferase [Betaproteobacteria bacterium]
MLKKILGPFREFGPGAGLLYALDRVLSALSPNLRVYVYEFGVQPITDRPLLPERRTRNFEVREIGAGDLELASMPVPQAVIRTRFAQGARCLGAFQKGTFIGYMWFCRNFYEEDEARCTYVLGAPAESVFDFDYYLYPEYRMGLGFVALWNGANALLHREGIRHTFSRLTRFNLATRRAHAHLGCRVIGKAAFLRMGRAQLMVSTLAPYVRLTPAGSAPARLVLRPGREGSPGPEPSTQQS